MERLKQKKVIIQKRSANYLENSCDGILIIFYRSGPRAPDPQHCIQGSSPSLTDVTLNNPKATSEYSWDSATPRPRTDLIVP